MKLQPGKEYELSFNVGRYKEFDNVMEDIEQRLKEYGISGAIYVYHGSKKGVMLVNIFETKVEKEISYRTLMHLLDHLDPHNIYIVIDGKRYTLKDELNPVNSGHTKKSIGGKKIKKSWKKGRENINC